MQRKGKEDSRVVHVLWRDWPYIGETQNGNSEQKPGERNRVDSQADTAHVKPPGPESLATKYHIDTDGNDVSEVEEDDS